MDDDIEILDKTTAFQGYFRVDRYRLRHRRFDDGWTRPFVREVFERGHAVALLPYDPARDEVVLVEQFRVGALAAGWKPWLLEGVAGIIEPGETPEEVARREAIEEAALKVTDLVLAHRYLVSPGGASETCTLYCGRADASGLHGAIRGVDDEHEHIRVHVLPRTEAWTRVADGRICNAAAVIALQWLELNHVRLRATWR
jgi:ADP-ribose pyrophosphatase